MDSAVLSAPGIEYQEAHGLRLFRCEAQAATLTTTSCISNYRAAKKNLEIAMRPHLHHCQYCPIGAAHCGEKPRVRASMFCPRCHRSGLRFIQSHAMCVSCYNRQGEIRRGRNRNGNPPIELLKRAPVQRSIVFVHEGRRVQYNRLAVDSFEPMLAAVFMARSPETLRFVFGRPDLEPADSGPAPDWQRASTVMERRSLDRERTKKRRESKCGTS